MFVLLFCVVYGTGLSAQEQVLSKDEAIKMALLNNFDIKVARNQVDIARTIRES